jgi:integrase
MRDSPAPSVQRLRPSSERDPDRSRLLARLKATLFMATGFPGGRARVPFRGWILDRPVDPMRPITTIKSTRKSVRDAADVNGRFHDLRYSAYRKMVEAGVPEGVIMAVMGHVSRALAERYSHIRMDAMRKAVSSLALTKAEAAWSERDPAL